MDGNAVADQRAYASCNKQRTVTTCRQRTLLKPR